MYDCPCCQIRNVSSTHRCHIPFGRCWLFLIVYSSNNSIHILAIVVESGEPIMAVQQLESRSFLLPGNSSFLSGCEFLEPVMLSLRSYKSDFCAISHVIGLVSLKHFISFTQVIGCLCYELLFYRADDFKKTLTPLCLPSRNYSERGVCFQGRYDF